MRSTHVTVEVEGLLGSSADAQSRSMPTWTSEFLVDTGAIDCLAPASVLANIGIGPVGEDIYELANGQLVKYPFGYARVRFFGTETVTKIILAEEGVEPILGVVALESTGVGVDPVSRSLRRMGAKPLK